MAKKPVIAVLGGGNGAFCHAADLTLKGFSVNLCEVPEMAENLSGIVERGGIELKILDNAGVEPGFARLEKVTTNAQEALENASIIIVVVPAFAQRRFAEFCAKSLRTDQLVLLSPGNFGGCLEFRKILRTMGSRETPFLCETECMTYAGIKTGPAEVEIAGYKEGHTMAAFPGRMTDEALDRLKGVFPSMRAAKSILETGLRNVNTVMHPPMMILNAGRIEDTKGEFRLYWHGVTEGVGYAIEQVEEERMAIGRALKLNLDPMRDVLLRWYGHCGASGSTLSQVMRTNPVYEFDSAPPTLHHRYLTEDIPYGMVPLERMGKFASVPTPVTTAFIELASAMLQENMRESARDLDSLGLKDMSLSDLTAFFVEGPEAVGLQV